MEIIVGVKNFGKIEAAEINIENYTVFVGNNNSGKTYMMQLIYGIILEIVNMKTYGGTYGIDFKQHYSFDSAFFENLQREINQYLEQNKEQIIFRIFQSLIPIEKMWVELRCGQSEYTAAFTNNISGLITNISRLNESTIYNYVSIMKANEEKFSMGFRYDENTAQDELATEIIRQVLGDVLGIGWMFKGDRKNVLYLPASRTGILLLYKYFFSEKDRAGREVLQLGHGQEEQEENAYRLTAPVYHFLQFLLRYTSSERKTKKNQSVLSFIEEHLIDGKLEQNGEETMYIPTGSGARMPLYLSSSMVNEAAPLVKALTGVENCEFLFYDEVETCLHPVKQREMARLLNRLNNQGMRLIISTHSDIMASQLNNLFMLSFAEEPEEVLDKKLEALHLEREDLLKTKAVHIYQFINDERFGKSSVTELEFRQIPYTGYHFSLFTDSALKVYQDSVTIVENK